MCEKAPIEWVRARIQTKLNIQYLIRLVSSGKQLEDGHLLSDYTGTDTIHVHLSLLGGRPMQFYKPMYTAMYRDDGIVEGPGVTMYHCTLCNASNRLGEDAEKKIEAHIRTAKHQRNKEGQHWTVKYQAQVRHVENLYDDLMNNSRAYDNCPRLRTTSDATSARSP
jgi:hypothetical protein